jgi:hypothetical protein
MKAQEILLAMQAKYATMSSYQDRGVVLQKFPDEPDANETTFATFFRRPGHFRFEWNTHHPYSGLRHLRTHTVIWSDGTGVFRFSDRNGAIEPRESLPRAIAGATGVSSGAAHTLSALLIADVRGFTLPQLQRLTLQRDEYDGVECHRIGGYHPNGEFCEVFVGIHDLLLRRLYEPSCGGAASEEIRRDIRVDEPIDDQIFQFRPAAS